MIDTVLVVETFARLIRLQPPISPLTSGIFTRLTASSQMLRTFGYELALRINAATIV